MAIWAAAAIRIEPMLQASNARCTGEAAMAQLVNVDNFRAAETARLFDDSLKLMGATNQWFHYRRPTGVEHQPVIRMNRDPLQRSDC